jgi:tetratricopeptide (TPR) repeat protein
MAFYQGTDKKIDGYAYTLENLQKYGGICGDQAYFATQIGRALGVPTVTIIGQGGGGEVAHAWIGFLERKNRTVVWNLRSGRYESQLYWTGQVVDPQSREMISESDTSLLAELQSTTPKQRVLAQALLRSVEIFDKPRQPELLIRVLNTSAGNREAWMKLADLGRDGVLTKDQANQVADVVKKFASKQYADLAYEVYRRMISGRSNLDQLEQLDWLIGIFKERPDLIAAVRVEQGKLLHSLKRDDQALRAYGDVLTNHLDAGPVVLEAMQRTDELLREQKDFKRLVSIYEQVFRTIPQPQASSALAAYTPFCTIGVRYAELMEELGDKPTALKIRQRVAVYDKSANNDPRLK